VSDGEAMFVSLVFGAAVLVSSSHTFGSVGLRYRRGLRLTFVRFLRLM